MEPNIKNRYDIILSLNISDAINAANINKMEAAIPVVPRVFIYMILRYAECWERGFKALFYVSESY